LSLFLEKYLDTPNGLDTTKSRKLDAEEIDREREKKSDYGRRRVD
jgi:hypothetical protein